MGYGRGQDVSTTSQIGELVTIESATPPTPTNSCAASGYWLRKADPPERLAAPTRVGESTSLEGNPTREALVPKQELAVSENKGVGMPRSTATNNRLPPPSENPMSQKAACPAGAEGGVGSIVTSDGRPGRKLIEQFAVRLLSEVKLAVGNERPVPSRIPAANSALQLPDRACAAADPATDSAS